MGNMLTYAFTYIQFHLFSIHLKRKLICISTENLNPVNYITQSMMKSNVNSEASNGLCEE